MLKVSNLTVLCCARMTDMNRWIWENGFFERMDFTYGSVDMSGLLKKIDELNKIGTDDSIRVEVLSDELIYSFLIESVVLDRASVYSSVGKVFNLNIVQNYKWTEWGKNLAMLLKDARENFGQWGTERLFDYHRALFSSYLKLPAEVDIGSYRKDLCGRMRVVSERELGKEIVHYVAPHAKDLRYLMDNFYDYVNRETAKTREDKIAHAFISHLVFVLIHPLDDGNGRIARIINDNLLAKSKIFNHGYYSVSTGIFLTRKDYYAVLEEVCTQRHNNITKWVKYGVACLEKGIDLLLKQIALIAVKTGIFDCFARDLNKREVQLIQSLFEKHLRNLRGKSTSLTLKTKQQDHDEDILHLEELGILKRVPNASLKNLKFGLDFNIVKKTSYLRKLEKKEQNRRKGYFR